MPDSVAKEYGEALKERRRNPNGYAALLGRVLDAVCTERGITQSIRLPPGFQGSDCAAPGACV